MGVRSRQVRTYPCDVESAAAARAFAIGVVQGLGNGDVGAEVASVVGELVANAIAHTEGASFTLTVEADDVGCLVQVEDDGPYRGEALPDFAGPLDPFSTCGRGLLLVAELCPKEHGIRRSETTAGLVAWGRVGW